MEIMNFNPFRKRHPAAFSGSAICPRCFGTKVKFLESRGPYVRRYQCKACTQIYLDDMTPNGFYADHGKRAVVGDPYATLSNLKPVWRIGVHKFKRT